MTVVDAQREHLFVGWDVGGWNCDKNQNSRDALVVLDHTGQCIGQPWRGNLRETINSATTPAAFLAELLALCKLGNPGQSPHATLAIDAPLGFPEAFASLIAGGTPVDQIGRSAANPYLFRHTERRLVAEGVTPLSAIKDMIGSQATKAMHVVARFAPQRLSPGIWTDGKHLTVIETYPALCRARLGPQVGTEPIPKTGRDADIHDAEVCARIARDFDLNRERLESPTDDTPASEGWIWAPRRVSVEA